MTSHMLPRLVRASHRVVSKTIPFVRVSLPAIRHASTSKHPPGFMPPTTEDLYELRERVQDFTRREITEEGRSKDRLLQCFPQRDVEEAG